MEETVIETGKDSTSAPAKFKRTTDSFTQSKDDVLNADYIEPEIVEVETDSYNGFGDSVPQTFVPQVNYQEIQNIDLDEPVYPATVFDTVIPGEEPLNVLPPLEPEKPATPVNQGEFFRNRATNEVLSLQMVEHVLAGVERDVLNVAPKLYDELSVKKALHEFLQISAKSHTPEHAQAEFLLMQQTESWYSALSHKDKNIKVGHLRRFCENSRPALSSQALVSLAGFYRNAPYSESIRSKFDLILTRLFSKEVGNGKRALICSRDELIEKISGLYAEWSSIPLYSAEDDDSGIVLAAMKVEDFMTEADSADSFEELVKNDFFNRLRVFKESTQENFFAPLLAATVVESNIRIGNRYAELFEREQDDAETLEEKYGLLHEQTISEVICKTLIIRELVNPKTVKAVKSLPKSPVFNDEAPKTENPKTETVQKGKKTGNNFIRVNKWLLGLVIFTLLATAGLYIWVETVSDEEALVTNVKNVNLDNSSLKEHIQAARISGDIFYGVVMPSWDTLSREQKEAFTSKVMLVGAEKGFSRVNLINKQGKTVGFASSQKIEIFNP